MGADELPLVGVRHMTRGTFVGFEYRWRMAPGGDVLRHPGSVTAEPWDGEHAHLICQLRAPMAAARRQAAEGIGLALHRLTLLHRVFVSPWISDEQAWVYLAEELLPVAARPQGPEERASVHLRWTRAEIVCRPDEVKNAVCLIGMLALLWYLAS